MQVTYVAKGLTIEESTGDVGAYDPVTGQITWTTQQPWVKIGPPPQLQGQELTFTNTTGHATLYLHGENMGASNTRGPGRASTCIAKIPLDPRTSVNHVSIQRPHRWIAQPRGTLSTLTFTLRDVYGTLHKLSDHGQNISFVLTWGQQD